MKAQVTFEEKEYTLATITAGVNKSFPESDNPKEFSFNLVVESLRAGGMSDPETLASNLPDGIFDAESPYKKIVQLAMKLNGYKEAPKTGEEEAGNSPASTGDSSTLI